MKYFILFGLLLSCNKNPELDNSIKELEVSIKKLEFSTIGLECVSKLNTEELVVDMDRLSLPKTKEIAYILMDAKIYKCVKEAYGIDR